MKKIKILVTFWGSNMFYILKNALLSKHKDTAFKGEKMSKKFLCIGLSVLLLTTGCIGDNSTLSNRLISLDEIRAEAENMLELNQKHKNLSLFETEINIPTTEQIKNFSLFPVSLSPEERETFLLDIVRWFGGEERDINNIIYLPYDGDDLSYSQVRDDPDRGSNYFVCYKDGDL